MTKIQKDSPFLRRPQFTRAAIPVTKAIDYYNTQSLTDRNYDFSKRTWCLLQIIDGNNKLARIT